MKEFFRVCGLRVSSPSLPPIKPSLQSCQISSSSTHADDAHGDKLHRHTRQNVFSLGQRAISKNQTRAPSALSLDLCDHVSIEPYTRFGPCEVPTLLHTHSEWAKPAPHFKKTRKQVAGRLTPLSTSKMTRLDFMDLYKSQSNEKKMWLDEHFVPHRLVPL